jgi:hypothetical protein
MTQEQINKAALQKPVPPEDRRSVWARLLSSVRVRIEPRFKRGRLSRYVSIKGGVEF